MADEEKKLTVSIIGAITLDSEHLAREMAAILDPAIDKLVRAVARDLQGAVRTAICARQMGN